MRPRSIILFERYFLAAAAIAVLNVLVNYGSLREYSLSRGGAAASSLLGMAIGLAFNLTFWFFIARRASNTIKWVLAAFTGLGLLIEVPNAAAGKFGAISTLYLAIMVLTYGLNLIGVSFLFRRDATNWLKSRGKSGPVDPEIFS